MIARLDWIRILVTIQLNDMELTIKKFEVLDKTTIQEASLSVSHIDDYQDNIVLEEANDNHDANYVSSNNDMQLFTNDYDQGKW